MPDLTRHAAAAVEEPAVEDEPRDRRTLNPIFPLARLRVTADGRRMIESGRYELTAEGERTTITVR